MNRSDLHPYQAHAVDFICEKKRCALWLFLGAGKTVITLTAIKDLLDACVIKRVLIIAPLRVCQSVWKQEAAKWAHLKELRVSIATGSAQRRKTALNAPADVYLINKENTQWLVDLCAEKKRWPYDCVVIDEMSAFKSYAAKRFKKLKKVIPHTTVMVGLTGTPSPNSLMDVWSQIFLIDGGKALGRGITEYRKRFFTPDFWGHNWDIKAGSAEKIKALIKPLILSMKGSDYIQLPSRIDITERVELPKKVMEQYQSFEKELFLEFQDVEIEALSAAVLAGRLLQFTSGAIYTDEDHNWKTLHTAKLDALEEIIEQNSGENILLAYSYKHELKRLQARFPQAVKLDKDPKTIDRWNNRTVPLMLCHPQSAAHGVNLQYGGSVLIWASLTWSLEGYQQLVARLWRQGQERPVRVVHLIAEGTIDSRVLDVLKSKDAVQSDLLAALR